jgi:hypothetical protein
VKQSRRSLGANGGFKLSKLGAPPPVVQETMHSRSKDGSSFTDFGMTTSLGAELATGGGPAVPPVFPYATFSSGIERGHILHCPLRDAARG